jgi:hypothetical protein
MEWRLLLAPGSQVERGDQDELMTATSTEMVDPRLMEGGGLMIGAARSKYPPRGQARTRTRYLDLTTLA